MKKVTLLKESFAYRPSNAAWKPLFEKHERDRRPINQILNDIVIEYFTPKLFENVSVPGRTPEVIKKVAKRNTAAKKAKTKA